MQPSRLVANVCTNYITGIFIKITENVLMENKLQYFYKTFYFTKKGNKNIILKNIRFHYVTKNSIMQF